jgi:hypothetical protein
MAAHSRLLGWGSKVTAGLVMGGKQDGRLGSGARGGLAGGLGCVAICDLGRWWRRRWQCRWRRYLPQWSA